MNESNMVEIKNKFTAKHFLAVAITFFLVLSIWFVLHGENRITERSIMDKAAVNQMLYQTNPEAYMALLERENERSSFYSNCCLMAILISILGVIRMFKRRNH